MIDSKEHRVPDFTPGPPFYCTTLAVLDRAQIPFLVGGAYALHQYTGIARDTKDFDIFVRPADAEQALAILTEAGYHTELLFPHWLGKAFCGEYFVDVIFASGNGLSPVDDDWFAYAREAEVLGRKVHLCPPEELIWSKAFIMERERYDGADVLHILRTSAQCLDWSRLIGRFGRHWRVLLNHIILFGFVYPSERHRIPASVVETLLAQLHSELTKPLSHERLCQGTLLSREQYLVDIEQWGYQDARLLPQGCLTAEEISDWTAQIANRNRTAPRSVES
jgi:hypothetical protein